MYFYNFIHAFGRKSTKFWSFKQEKNYAFFVHDEKSEKKRGYVKEHIPFII